ncbi:type VII toxin-antitoxin system HepT family RNase toxin [Halosimplex halobium]|uniref:type VII toxin-antitoxin system HepT family RNase toxin n=1 Tax=Halosimplex halobium TaxID=3396618 RepID=UPI003F55262B
MDEPTRRRVVEKASYVRDAVELLAEKRDSLSFEEYRDSREDRAVVERELQTAIEACIDIGEMLLRSQDIAVPETNRDVFRRLEAQEVLDDATADRMARAAGLRNILTHQYGADIDDEAVYTSLQNQLDVFEAYLTQIRDAID